LYGCIEIVRKITFATSFVRKGPLWRTTSNLKCSLKPENQPSSRESDQESAPDTISDNENLLIRNGALDIPNYSEDDCASDNESDIKYNNSREELECTEQQDVSTTPNVPRLVSPTQKSKRQAEKVLVTVHAIETRRNKGVTKK